MKQNVIQRAILSEKVYAQIEHGIYTFLVSANATKFDIKKAVELQFSAKVLKVRVQSSPSKTKKVTGTRKTTQVGGGKKAIVFLKKGEKIAILSPKTEKKEKASKDKKVSNDSTETKDKPKKEGLFSKIRKTDKVKEDKK